MRLRGAGIRLATAVLAAGALLLAAPAPSRAQVFTPGEIFVTNLNTGSLIQLPADGSTQTGLITNGITAVEATPNELIFMTANEVIVRFVPGVGGFPISIGGYLDQGTDIALEPDGSILANNDANEIIRINAQTGAQSVLSSDGYLTGNFGIAVAPDGQIYVTNVDAGGGGRGAAPADGFSGGSVIRIDPVTGDQFLVSEGGELGFPTGITVGADGYLYVSDVSFFASGGEIPSRVVRINPATGAQTVVAVADEEEETLLVPFSIDQAPDGSLVVADAFAAAVERIDLLNGNVTVVSSDGLLGAPFNLSVVPGVGASTRNVRVLLGSQAMVGRTRTMISGSVQVNDEGIPGGHVTFSQGGLRFISRRIRQVVVTGNTARIYGIASTGGSTAAPFVITVVDGGRPGSRLDLFSAGINGQLVIDGAVVTSGDIRIFRDAPRGRRGR